MKKMTQVAIVGGTHGNEFSGIYLLKKWSRHPQLLTREGLAVETVFANPNSYAENKRYIDSDLNRQFTEALLADDALDNGEQRRAKQLNHQLGPKGDARTDVIIDLHNTTSNMGPTLILLQSDTFNRQLGAYVLSKMDSAVVVFEDHISMEEHDYLASVGKQGVIVEIGPQPQSVVRQDVLEWMETMTHTILDFVEKYNTGDLPTLPETYQAYRYVDTIRLPEDEQGHRLGMVHKDLQDGDFKPLKKGDPLFTLFDGTLVHYQGDDEVYPHFINEAAYHASNVAMSLGKKITVPTRA